MNFVLFSSSYRVRSKGKRSISSQETHASAALPAASGKIKNGPQQRLISAASQRVQVCPAPLRCVKPVLQTDRKGNPWGSCKFTFHSNFFFMVGEEQSFWLVGPSRTRVLGGGKQQSSPARASPPPEFTINQRPKPTKLQCLGHPQSSNKAHCTDNLQGFLCSVPVSGRSKCVEMAIFLKF